MMARRPSSLRLPLVRRVPLAASLAGAAGLAAIANVIAVAAPAADTAPTRLGTAINQSVADQDAARARQQRSMDMREQALKASEARLKADLQSRQPNAAAPALTGGARGGTDQGETPYDDLARIYQTMKPARAAPIFERLDLDVQIAVARRMRERSTALIMAGMTPMGAVRLSMAMAGKRVDPPAPVPAPTMAATPNPPVKNVRPAAPARTPASAGNARSGAAQQAAQPTPGQPQKS